MKFSDDKSNLVTVARPLIWSVLGPSNILAR